MYQEVFKMHADLFKALAHPRRLEVINLLQSQEMSVTDMQKMLGLPQANLSQHLMLLRKYAVVSYRKEGKQVFYKIAHRNFVKACALVRNVLVERYDKEPLGRELEMAIKEFLPVAADPVCGMRMPVRSASASYKFQGQTYYFCATGCKEKFARTPRRFVTKDNGIGRIKALKFRFRNQVR